MKIKNKLVLAFSAVSGLSVVLVAALVVVNLRGQAIGDFSERADRELAQVDATMRQFFDAVEQNVDALAADPRVNQVEGLKHYMGADAAEQPSTAANDEMLKIFDVFAKTHPNTAYVAVATADGGFVNWPDDPKLKSYDPRKRPFYQAAVDAAGKTVRTGAYFWASDNSSYDSTLIGTVKSIFDAQGKVRGVVSLDVSLNQLTTLVKSIRFGDSGYLMLVESNGNVLVDARTPANNFKKLDEIGAQYAPLANLKTGDATVVLDGVTYLARVVSSDKLGWRFIGLIQRDEVLAKVTSLTWLIFAIAAASAVIFALVGAAFAQVIARSIQHVADGLGDIAQGEGDLSRQLPVTGNDETSLLARAFNRFLGTIATLIRRIGEASRTLQQVSGEGAGVAQSMNEAALRQREAVELVSTAFNEMVATANEVARSCASAAGAADAGRQYTRDGRKHIEDATGSADQLSTNLGQARDSMLLLEQDSVNINSILDTIRAIAEQTNLLALNAAIEAARAGDQGRGFAVVADEVRALARRTADSTGEIDSLLGNLGKRTLAVTQQMQKSLDISALSVERIQLARDSFEKVLGVVEDIRDQTAQIATAAEEQHQVSEDINRHILRIQDDAQQVEELAQQSNAGARQINDISGDLSSLVGRFRY